MPAWKYLSYGAGQLGVMIVVRYFFQWLIFFCEGRDTGKGALFSASIVGLLFFAFRVFDAVADPLAGAFGDSWVKRGRQRRTLIWFSFAVPAIGLTLIFAPTYDMGAALRWVLLSAGMFVFFVGYTLYAIPYWALVEDYAEGQERVRTRLSNMLGAGVLLATGVVFVLSGIVIDKIGFLPGAIIFGIAGTLLMMLPYFAAPPSGGRADPSGSSAPLREVLTSSLKDRRFFALIVLYVGSQMSFTMMTSAAPFIATDLLGGTKADVAKLLGPFLVGSLLSFAFVPRLARALGWERATLVATLALGVAYAGAGLLGQGRR